MNKKILSVLLCGSLLFGTIGVNAVSIEFEDMEQSDKTLEIETDDKSIAYEELETEEIDLNKVIQDEGDTLSKVTVNKELEYFPSVMMEIPISDNTNQEVSMLNNLNIQPLTENVPIMKLSNSTVIDCTDLFAGTVISHDCSKYLSPKKNTSQHWNECVVCGKKYNVSNHNYTQYWTLGNSCNPNNKLLASCSCGYNYTVSNNTRSHNLVLSSTQYQHGYCCTSCQNWFNTVDHYDSYGNLLRCGIRIGNCVGCGRYIGVHEGNAHYNTVNNTFSPAFCQIDRFTIINNASCSLSYSGNNFYLTAVGTYFCNLQQATTQINGLGLGIDTSIANISSTSYYFSGNNVVVNINGYFVSGVEKNTSFQAINMSGTASNGINFSSALTVTISPDKIAPTISEITQKDLSTSQGWSTSKQITITGYENWCNSVYITVQGENGEVIVNNERVNTSSKNYTYNFIPHIEVGEEGETYNVTVSDAFGNKSSSSFTVYKVDSKEPVPVSETSTSQEWSKTKDITCQATDKGIQNVSISFNDEENFIIAEQDGNSFGKQYTLTGDVYGSTNAAIYYKDGVGNTETQFITIYNLDNTAPTITDAVSQRQGVRNAVVTVTANDINTKLNASGSGVIGYAITQDKDIPDENAFQSSNTFNLTKSGIWYVWAIDAVGNISAPVAVDVKIEYTVSLNPNDGTLTGDSSYQVISGETITIPEPTKTGYTFTGWTVEGEESSVNGNDFTMGSEDTEITAQWKINKYPVTYIDKTPDGKEIGRTTIMVDYDTLVRGSDIGDSNEDNAYHNQYRYVSDTSATVTTKGATVYRVFEFCETEKESHLTWSDNNNEDGLRPDKYVIKLKQNGKVIDEVELPSDVTDYVFENLPKYDEDGNPYEYELETIVSDRYKPEYGEDGSLIFQDYQPAHFSVIIPKTIVLDGRTGNADYTVSVNGTFYYNDTLTVIPESSLILTDRSKISSMQANVSQQKVDFTKADGVANGTTANGSIQAKRNYFSGLWRGTFNFDIKFVMQN